MEMKRMEKIIELSTGTHERYSKQDILPILREYDTGKALRNSYLWLYYTLFLWGLLGTITWLSLGWPPSEVDKDINIISKKVMLIGIFLELILLSFLGMQDITRDGWEEKKLTYHTDNPINFFTSVQLILSSFVAVINLIFYYRENLYTKEERGYTIFLILSLGLLYGGLDEAFEFHEAMGYYYIPKLLDIVGLKTLDTFINKIFGWGGSTLVLFILAIGVIAMFFFLSKILRQVKMAFFLFTMGITFQFIALLCEQIFPYSAEFPSSPITTFAYIEEISELLGSFCYLLSLLILFLSRFEATEQSCLNV